MVSDVIKGILKERGQTKQWLAERLNLSYSTFHQKLSKNTFTAEEFIQLCNILNLTLANFVEPTTEGKIDLKKYPIESRPDVHIEERDTYYKAGIHVESEHEAGICMYMPYGIVDYMVSKENFLSGLLMSYEKALQTHLKEELTDELKVELMNQEFTLSVLKELINYMILSMKES